MKEMKWSRCQVRVYMKWHREIAGRKLGKCNPCEDKPKEGKKARIQRHIRAGGRSIGERDTNAEQVRLTWYYKVSV